MTNEGAIRKSRVPHWGWLPFLTIVIVVGFIAVRFAVPMYRLQRMITDLRSRNCRIRGRHPHWLYNWIQHEDLRAAFCSFIELEAHGVPFTDEDLRQLRRMTNLDAIELGATQITDAGLVHLASFSKLEKLEVGGTQITDSGYNPMRALPLPTRRRLTI